MVALTTSGIVRTSIVSFEAGRVCDVRATLFRIFVGCSLYFCEKNIKLQELLRYVLSAWTVHLFSIYYVTYGLQGKYLPGTPTE